MEIERDINQQRQLMQLGQISIVYFIFCAVSWLSRFFYPLFGLIVLGGIVFPLIWGRFTGNWGKLGFSKDKLGPAVLWGIGAGAVTSFLGLLVLGYHNPPSNLLQQLLIGIPFWLLVISPFQEFFFRGWFQRSLSISLGNWRGLIIASAGFTFWHYVSPIVDLSPYPLESAAGISSTFLAGLAYGYVFSRSNNILSPWLGHAISGIVFIVIGAMDFVIAFQ